MGNKASKPSELSASDTIIAVIGESGSGKSTFINTVAATNSLEVSHSLQTGTTRVQHVLHGPESGFHGRIIFVDTPPFPDPYSTRTTQEDMERIDHEVGTWLEKSFGGKRVRVDGILYLLSMRNNRITPPPRLLFEKLCGDDYSGRVLLVATMWERARNQELLETRKADLMDHWGTIIIEHDGTKKSAWSIVNSLLHTCREA